MFPKCSQYFPQMNLMMQWEWCLWTEERILTNSVVQSGYDVRWFIEKVTVSDFFTAVAIGTRGCGVVYFPTHVFEFNVMLMIVEKLRQFSFGNVLPLILNDPVTTTVNDPVSES